MRRRLFILSSAVFLLLSATTLVLWDRSHRLTERVTIRWTREYEIASFDGRLMLSAFTTFEGPPSALWVQPLSPNCQLHLKTEDYDLGRFIEEQFRYDNYDEPGTAIYTSSSPPSEPNFERFRHIRMIVFPYWLLFSSTIAFPGLIAVRLVLSMRSRKNGLCRICSYDLRRNTSGVCPECGTVIPA